MVVYKTSGAGIILAKNIIFINLAYQTKTGWKSTDISYEAKTQCSGAKRFLKETIILVAHANAVAIVWRLTI